MLSLFRAEWQKIAGNRLVTLFMIWIFPIAAAAAAIVLPASVLVSPEARILFRTNAAVLRLWTDSLAEILSLPNSGLGRMLFVGFAAFAFAGEYQWRTWKNIIPRSQRVRLILCKFGAVCAFEVLAFALASAILSLGIGLAAALAGGTLVHQPGDALTDWASKCAAQALLTLISALIAAGYAAVAGLVTRSMLGGVLFGLGAVMGEQFLLVGLMQIADWLHEPRVLSLYRFTPSYNASNILSQFSDSSSIATLLGLPAHSPAFSWALLVAWGTGLVALATLLFQRQDITS